MELKADETSADGSVAVGLGVDIGGRSSRTQHVTENRVDRSTVHLEAVRNVYTGLWFIFS